MRTALSIVAQTILFLLVFLLGTFLDPFHLKWFIHHPSSGATRFFVPDGLLLMLALYLLLLAVSAARKRFAASGRRTSIAFTLALILGLLSRFGFATHDRF